MYLLFLKQVVYLYYQYKYKEETIMKNQLGKTISALRRENGWSQKETALKLGVSQALLSHYEKGIRECGLDFLTKAAAVFNCSTDYLLGLTDSPYPTKNDTDSISADLKQYPKFEKSRNDAINTFSLLYSITARLGNPEICKDFNKIVLSDTYLLVRALENRYFDSENFNKDMISAIADAKQVNATAFSGLIKAFNREKTNLNLSKKLIAEEYPTCSKSLSSIINSFE